jgi:hypothetical protein
MRRKLEEAHGLIRILRHSDKMTVEEAYLNRAKNDGSTETVEEWLMKAGPDVSETKAVRMLEDLRKKAMTDVVAMGKFKIMLRNLLQARYQKRYESFEMGRKNSGDTDAIVPQDVIDGDSVMKAVVLTLGVLINDGIY